MCMCTKYKTQSLLQHNEYVCVAQMNTCTPAAMALLNKFLCISNRTSLFRRRQSQYLVSFAQQSYVRIVCATTVCLHLF